MYHVLQRSFDELSIKKKEHLAVRPYLALQGSHIIAHLCVRSSALCRTIAVACAVLGRARASLNGVWIACLPWFERVQVPAATCGGCPSAVTPSPRLACSSAAAACQVIRASHRLCESVEALSGGVQTGIGMHRNPGELINTYTYIHMIC